MGVEWIRSPSIRVSQNIAKMTQILPIRFQEHLQVILKAAGKQLDRSRRPFARRRGAPQEAFTPGCDGPEDSAPKPIAVSAEMPTAWPSFSHFFGPTANFSF